MKPIKELEIVVGICERDGKYLLIQRKDHRPIWDKKWEFPGGKLEAGEEPACAIAREILEETSLLTLSSRFLRIHKHDWDLEDYVLRVHIHSFHCYLSEGEPRVETDKAYFHRWVTAAEVLEMDTLAANKDILNAFFHETVSNMG